jgi:tRNA(adenine34) deaminase
LLSIKPFLAFYKPVKRIQFRFFKLEHEIKKKKDTTTLKTVSKRVKMTKINFSDQYFMQQAFKQAQLAYEKDEVPVGAVVVSNGIIIAKAHNLTETLNDVTAHAEMLAITASAEALGGKYLNQCTLYVTVEPCPMCGGALNWAQIGRVVYGAADSKRGCLRHQPSVLHPKTELVGGVMEKECSELMKQFFSAKR